jgi:NADH-quinone oxidoreductase subunit N
LSLSKPNFCIAFSFSFLLFSTAGIPPLAGFFSKLCILSSLLSQKLLVTIILIVIFSSVACFYYIRLTKICFFSASHKNIFWLGSGTKNIEIFLSFSLLSILLCLSRFEFFTGLSTLAASSVF